MNIIVINTSVVYRRCCINWAKSYIFPAMLKFIKLKFKIRYTDIITLFCNHSMMIYMIIYMIIYMFVLFDQCYYVFFLLD